MGKLRLEKGLSSCGTRYLLSTTCLLATLLLLADESFLSVFSLSRCFGRDISLCVTVRFSH